MPVVHATGGVLVVVEIAAGRRAAAAVVHRGLSEVGLVASAVRRWRTSVGRGQRLAAVVMSASGGQLHVSEILIMTAAVVVDVVLGSSNPVKYTSYSCIADGRLVGI